jgi:four helix bundle protein
VSASLTLVNTVAEPSGSAVSAASSAAAAVVSAMAVPTASADFTAADDPQLDANKLYVYNVALELHVHAASLVSPLTRTLRDQLERASLSVVLNIAEAGGRRSRRDKARFYAIARGSSTEVAALLDVLAMRRLASPAAVRTGRRLAIRCVQMLSKIDRSLLR